MIKLPTELRFWVVVVVDVVSVVVVVIVEDDVLKVVVDVVTIKRTHIRLLSNQGIVLHEFYKRIKWKVTILE